MRTDREGTGAMHIGTGEDSKAPLLGRLEALTVVAVVGVLALALGLAALMAPPTVNKTHRLNYTQSGAFSYRASASAKSPYGAAGLSTGEPIVAGSVGPVNAGFSYRLTGPSAAGVHGTATLVATVTVQGLSRRFVLAPPAQFDGTSVSVHGTLPLDAIVAFAAHAGSALGGLGMNGGTVTLTPTISATGSLAGHPLSTSFAPTLDMTLSGKVLTPGSSSSGGGAISTTTASALAPHQQSSIDYQAAEPNTLPLLVAHPSVRTGMIVGFGLALLCLLLGLWFARPLLRPGGVAGERERIRAVYGGQLLAVRAVAIPDCPVAEVASIDALAQLAKRYESMIMQVDEPAGDAYLVWDNGMLYRYRPEAEPSSVVELSDDRRRRHGA